MNINREIVEKTAHLARLYLTEIDIEEMIKSMSEITDWMEKLNELDTSDVVPLIQMSEEINVMRTDIAENSLSHEEGLLNSPVKDSDYFIVPNVLEKTNKE